METRQLTIDALNAKRLRSECIGGLPYGKDLDVDGISLIPNRHEEFVIGVILDLRKKGVSLRGIADELNRRGFCSKKGKPWQHTAVKAVLCRCSVNTV
jgi:site-specific DNA recombinase